MGNYEFQLEDFCSYEEMELAVLVRRTAWNKAELAKQRLSSCDTIPMREQIVDTATSTGFFSIWMTIFKQDQDMLQRFIAAFPGTSAPCFNANSIPVQRQGGAI